MPTETINYLRFVYRFPVISKLWKYLAALAIYTALVVVYTHEDPSAVDAPPPREKGAEAVLTGIVFGWLMSFRTNAAYARWWEGRVLWGQLVNECRNLALKGRQYFPDRERGNELGALLAEFAATLKTHLRSTPPRDPLTPMPPPSPHLPMEVVKRIYALLHSQRTANQIDGYTYLTLDQHALQLMNVCGACERIKNTPMTPSYRGLLRKGITGYMMVLPWILITDLDWFTVPVIVLIGYALIGLELIADSIENPFGHDGDDLPLDEIVETIRRNVASE